MYGNFTMKVLSTISIHQVKTALYCKVLSIVAGTERMLDL
jgi:hypothetical protein